MSQEIDGIFKDVTICCDTCDAERIFEANGEYVDFREMNAELKESGWRTYKDNDDWCHKCPECLQNRRSSNVE